MTVTGSAPLTFALPAHLEATEPPELRLGARDRVRLLVSDGSAAPVHSRFDRLGDHLRPGDLVVVNISATLAASVMGSWDDGSAVEVHFSTAVPPDPPTPATGPFRWVVEPRHPTGGASTSYLEAAFVGGGRPWAGATIELADGARLRLEAPHGDSRRLWVARVDLGAGRPPLARWLAAHGRAVRYRYVPDPWPIEAYQTVFATIDGSAEMPSAARPFTPEVVTSLVARGVGITPVVLHTGVSSLEAHEAPYPEWFEVPATTAERVVDTHRHGGRVIAVGTTVVRSLESAAAPSGRVTAARGWTDLVIGPGWDMCAVDGLLTGWHEPAASHLHMLEAIAGRSALEVAYGAAVAAGYRWHEFGDVHLLLP
jgi:S-adenosylmethionine:tRNA ribosyltransferase-isomerase